jgi:hypothetical protein
MSAVALSLPSAFVAPDSISEQRQHVGHVAPKNSVTIDLLRVDRLASLEEVWLTARHKNWDGANAEPVSAATFRKSRAFLQALPLTFETPEISVHPDGEVEFEWYRSPERVLTLAIGPEGHVSFAAIVNGTSTSGRRLFAGVIPADIARLLGQVAASAR